MPLKNSVYLRPHTPDDLEDLIWLAREVRALGGTAVVTASALLDGLTDAQAEAGLRGETVPVGEAPKRKRATEKPPRGGSWATRAGIKVDRIGSAWLIRRFIDPKARFRFLRPGERVRPDDVHFDMFDGAFTHEGAQCTFEVLLSRVGPARDPALRYIAEIVHDLDIKDDAFGHPETAGVGLMLEALFARTTDDRERLAAGGRLFEELYLGVSRRSRRRGSSTR